MRDAIVIGAGLSGLMGALALAEAGCRPLVLAAGQGKTHWLGGTIDLLGRSGNEPLRDTLEHLVTEQPVHPYARTGLAGIEEALARFRSLAEAAGFPYFGSLERNILLPTALGALRPATLLPATMVAGDIRLGGDILIAGFHELRDFFPQLIAANLRAQGVSARGISIQVPTAAYRVDYSTRTFAQLFDTSAFRLEIGAQLRNQRGKATRIGLPAVLGLCDPVGVLHDLQRSSGAQIFEIPTLPPSIPGMRLFTLFRNAIEEAGGRFQIGSTVVRGSSDTAAHTDNCSPVLTKVFTEAAAREQQHQARGFLLATGGIVGGGIRTDHRGNVWETALGLPLCAPTAREAWFAEQFLCAEGHPLFRAGIATDEYLRPVDSNDTIVYRNVTVAGSALAGIDPLCEHCMTGIALVTGWRAGRVLAQMLTG